MFYFLDRFFQKIAETKIDFFKGLFFFFGVVFFRFFLESLAALGPFRGFLPASSFIHYLLWYGVSFLFSVLIVSFFSQKSLVFVLKLILFFYPFILFPIIFPFILRESVNLSVSYVYTNNIYDFLETFLNFFFNSNFSFSLRIQIFLALLALGVFVYWSTKRWWRTIMAILVSYFLLILAGSIPSIVILLENSQKLYPLSFLLGFFLNQREKILIGRGYFNEPSSFAFNVWLDFVLSALLFPLLILGIGLVIFNWKRSWARIILGNLRFRKGFDFFLAALLGVGVGSYLFGQLPSFSFVNLIAFLNLFLVAVLFYGATAFFDDIYDKKIDIISHPERPLVSGKIDEKDSLKISAGLALLSLLGAAILSLRLFVLVLVSLFLAFLYSSPPFRLKRFFLLNTFVVVLVFLFFVLGGFFLVFPQKTIFDIPLNFFIFYLLLMMILVSLKDLADYQGDFLGGVKTLPVVLGLKKAQLFLAVSLSLLVFLFSFFFFENGFILKVWGAFFAFVLFILITHENFSEKRLYRAAIFFFLLFLFLWWLR